MKAGTVGGLAVLLAVAMGSGSGGYNRQEEFKEALPAEFGNWEDWHMWVEHQLDKESYSPEVFFKLHTTGDPNVLSGKDVLRMFGLARDEVVGQGDGMGDHDQTERVAPELKDRIVRETFQEIDKVLNDGVLRTSATLEEWLKFKTLGGYLPDFGIGPGHEFEFEEEYEKHHWNEHHASSDPEITQWHREDVEHELLHHFHEIEHDPESSGKYYEVKDLLWENIPAMFVKNT